MRVRMPDQGLRSRSECISAGQRGMRRCGEAGEMPNMVRFVAAVCAPAMAVVTWMIDSPHARRQRERLNEFNTLRRQFEGPRSDVDSYPLQDRVPTPKQATTEG